MYVIIIILKLFHQQIHIAHERKTKFAYPFPSSNSKPDVVLIVLRFCLVVVQSLSNDTWLYYMAVTMNLTANVSFCISVMEFARNKSQ